MLPLTAEVENIAQKVLTNCTKIADNLCQIPFM